MGGVFEREFELLLGRRTYDIFAAYWPHVAEDAPHRGIADAFNGATKHVATHDPDTLAWQNSRALGPDVVTTVRELKRSDGPDLVTQGSSELVHQLLATDLVDELRLLVYPILLGRGKRLLDDHSQAAAFRLEQSKGTSKGVLVCRYVREGEVRTGSFE
jgi:dihydrofolate reductase